MKRVHFIASTFLFTLVFALPMFAQTTGKVGIINTEAFYEEKGINKLTAAYTALDKEFAPKTQELQTMATRFETRFADPPRHRKQDHRMVQVEGVHPRS
jgi:Skp family chaperone for outer membrane proteins